MNLQLATRPEGALTVVTAAGELDLSTVPQLHELFIGLAHAGRYHLVVDLTAVTFIDSSGLGVFVGALKRVRTHDGSIKLAGLRPTVLKVFELTKLTTVFPIYDSVDDATGDEQGQPIPA